MFKRIVPGNLAYKADRAVCVLELKNISEAIIQYVDTDEMDIVRIDDLSVHIGESHSGGSFHDVSDKEWNKAVERFEIIRPLLSKSGRQDNRVAEVAKANGKSKMTLYRWIRKYEETGLVSSLLRGDRSDKGGSRLSSEQEEIVSECIEKYYMNAQRISVMDLYMRICLACREVDIAPPSRNTIYSRVRNIDLNESMKKRYSAKQAKQKFRQVDGTFPGADFPNAVVQVDHTPVDIIIVDDKLRQPIGRPYLTIAIDVATRMISGFNLSLDPPSSLTAGICLSFAMKRKNHWLIEHGFKDVEWPIYGKMQKIHVDNGAEFHSAMLKRACQLYGIILEHRPKGMPNFGPHVERAFRTHMQKIHTLPGTTFSNIKQKLEYDSEGNACMTLEELHQWFSTFLLYFYHHKPHKGISDVAPIDKYKKFVFGDKDHIAIGHPEPIANVEKLTIDFLPYFERTIQRQGVVVDNIHYYHDVLRPWIGRPSPIDGSNKFIFARDPRDISHLYFFDPDTKDYYPIPYRMQSRPKMSAWELKNIVKDLSKQGKSEYNENMIFEGLKKMYAIEDEAIEKTRLAKQSRATEKRKKRNKQRRESDRKTAMTPPTITDPSVNDDWGDGEIPIFETDINV